jgi:hypothetical protein
MIETLEDIVEDLANQVGVCGRHNADCVGHTGAQCRMCWVSELMGRIQRAVEVERKLST